MYPKLLSGALRRFALFSSAFVVLSFASAAEYSWRTQSQPWGFAGGWLIDGTTLSPQGGPGATDDIVTPQSFATVRLNGDHEINNITTDSANSWMIAGRTTGGTPKDSTLTIHGTLTKNGTGTFTISRTNELTLSLITNTIVMGANGGTLTFANDISTLAVNGDIAIGSNSTFNFGTPFSLQSGKTLSGAGLINANATLSTASGAIIAPGTAGIGTLSFSGAANPGTVLDATGAVLNFDFASGDLSDQIVLTNYNAGDLVLNATLNGTGVVPGTYQLVSFYSDSGITPATTGNVTSGLTLGTGFAGFTTTITYTAAGIRLTVAPESVKRSEYSWRAQSQPWAFAGGWLIDGTTLSPQGGPGANDDIVTPQAGSFVTIRLNSTNREINNITTDSAGTWSLAGRTTGGTPGSSSLTIHGTLTKNGTGTFNISRSNELIFGLTANTIVMGANGGTLNFANDISTLAVNGDIAIGSNSTFNFGTPFSLQSGKTLSGAGLINANATLSTATGAIIAPGTGGIGTLSFSGAANPGTVLDATGAVLNFDFVSGDLSDQIVLTNYNAGDLVLNATLNGTGVVPGTYPLISFYSDSGTTPATTGNLASGLTLGTGFAGFTTSINYTAAGIRLIVANDGDPVDPGTDPTDPTDPDEPDVPIVPPPGDQTWLPVAQRLKGVYDVGAIGNRGLQNQRVYTWNQGTLDPTRRGWIISGQDENSVRLSKDYGATWGFPRLAGLFCASMAGLYLNTDDDLFIAVGDSTTDNSANSGYSGLYVGDGSLTYAKRQQLTRDGEKAFTIVMSGNAADRNINCIGRRPQTGGLTDAERPIIVIEQVKAAGPVIAQIFVWISTDKGQTWNMVRELPIATYASGKQGVFQVLVAPNGDVVLLCQTGAYLTRDLFATPPTKIYPASGKQIVGSGYLYGGDANTPSSARIGVYEANANGGVYETSDIRNPAFFKPNGNAGLPANYRVWHMGGSPVNPDRLAVCTDGQPPYLSTDGGRTFTVIPENPGDGDLDGGRYNVRGKIATGHAGFHFCPTDEMICVIPTAQTMARSTNGAATSEGNLAAFFDGMHTKGVGFHPTNYLKIGRSNQDTGLNLSLDGMHWVRPTGTTKDARYNGVVNGAAVTTFGDAVAAAGGGEESYISGAGMCFAPNGDRVVGFFNRATGGQPNIPVIMENPVNGIYTSFTFPGVSKTVCAHSFASPKDPTVAFAGRWAISNLDAPQASGVSFTDHNGHEIISAFLDADGTTLMSYWANVSPGSATNQSGNAIWRSTHDLGITGQGASEAWYTLPQSRYKADAICADQHKPERILYVRNDSVHTIREVKRVNGVLQENELVNLRTMPGGLIDTIRAEVGDPNLTVPNLPIWQLLCDPNKEGVFYAIVGLQGTPNWWRSTDDGVTWTNISGNAPRTRWTAQIQPLTGEVLGFSSMGEHVLKSPDVEGYPALAHRDAYTHQLNAYFAPRNVKPSVATTALPDAIAGYAYNHPLEATGSNPAFVWSLASGTLPADLHLSADGVISGIATTAGTSTFTVKVADSDIFSGVNDEGTQDFSITITANSVPVIATTALPPGSVGTAYDQSLAATGGDGDLVWSVASGALPAGLSLSPTGVLSGTPTAAGTSTFIVQVADSDGLTDASDRGEQPLTVTIERGTAALALLNLNQVYDDTPRAVTVASVPEGLPVTIRYDGSATAPVAAGSYEVTATVSDDNYTGAATGTLTIAPATAAVVLGGGTYVYDGSPKSVSASTTPVGLNVKVLYNGSASAPIDAGIYAVQATIQEPNYAGSAAGTLTIAKAAWSIVLGDLVQRYDGTPRVVTAATAPTDLTVNVTYDGSATPPVNPGSYTVVGTAQSTNYSGTVSDTLVVGITALLRHAPTLNAGLDGSVQLLSGENTTLNGNAWVSGDLLVPGTPTVRLNGSPHYGGTVDDTGATTPTGYTITLNGNVVLRQVVRRVDPIPMPTVAAPPLPTGTVSVVLNSPSQSVANWTTLRNLTLNGTAGLRPIPPGTYGNFSANGSSGFIFGIAGATEPAVYNLQSLTLNTLPGGSSQLQVVGPVIITLANGAVINGTTGSSSHPEWLTLRFASGGLTLSGNVSFSGDVIAPNGTVTLNGNSELKGTVTADRLTLNGTSLLAEPVVNQPN